MQFAFIPLEHLQGPFKGQLPIAHTRAASVQGGDVMRSPSGGVFRPQGIDIFSVLCGEGSVGRPFM